MVGCGSVKSAAGGEGLASPTPHLPAEWQCEEFVLLTAQREVRRNGRPVPLGARAFDLLRTLVERRDRVVSKHELMELVWPGIYVLENNLQVHISALRRQLGQRVITTVPGRGYRFTGSVLPDLRQSGGGPMEAAIGAAVSPVSTRWPSEAAAMSASEPDSELLGRHAELASLRSSLLKSRLVTVLGAGGIGKTTLARKVNRGWPGRTAWVDISPLSELSLLVDAVAAALEAPLLASSDPIASVVRSVADTTALLVLDNAEHMATQVAALARALVHGCSGLTLLVTSQVPLRLALERVFRLGPLSTPQPGTVDLVQARRHGAMLVFEQAAQAADGRFELAADNANTVAELCRRLDGIPLAIQLAAARLPLLGLQGLMDRLDQRLDLLGRNASPGTHRQQTLRAELERSHALLQAVDQLVFRRLSVCVGTFSLELATSVALDDTLDRHDAVESLAVLVDHSMVVVEEGPSLRYRMLQSVHAFAAEALEAAGETTTSRARHARAMLAVMRQAHAAYVQTPEPVWCDTYLEERDNLRAALHWAVRHDPMLAIELLSASARFYQVLGHFHEALPLTERVLPYLAADVPPQVAWGFWVLRANAMLPVSRSEAAACFGRYVEAARESGDEEGLYLALCAGIGLGMVRGERLQGDLAVMQSLIRPQWPLYLHACLWLAEGMQAYQSGDLDRARKLLARMASSSRAVGKFRFAAHGLTILAGWDAESGCHDAAVQHAREAVAMQRQLGGWNLLLGLCSLVQTQLLSAEWPLSLDALRELSELTRRLGWRGLAYAVDGWALYAARCQAGEQAARLAGFAEGVFASTGAARDRMQALLRQQCIALLADELGAERLAQLMQEGEDWTPEVAWRAVVPVS